MLLLQYFNELTLQPENAQKLKGLILELAVRGKLTQQWRADNPDTPSAKVLLQQIKAEKKRLIAEKEIKQENPLPPTKAEEIPFDVPDSWVFERLGNLGNWRSGATPSRGNSEFYGNEYNWFKSGELNNSIIDYDSKEKITSVALKKTSVQLNSPGDVLIAMYGATIGKTGILSVYGTTNQAVCACTVFKGFNNEFLHTILKAYKQKFISRGEGGAQPNISQIKIRMTVIPLPPLLEQKAIVAIVEQLFEEVEQLAALTKERLTIKQAYVQSILQELETGDTHQVWQQLQPNFGTFFDTVQSVKALRQTVLQLAVQGKLTTDWRNQNPNVTPASELLKQIQTEKAALIKAGKITKETPLPKIKAEEIPFDLPVGWVWARLDDISMKIGDVDHKMPQSVNDGIPYISPRDFTNSDVINFENAKKISNEDYEQLAKKIFPERGDIIFPRYGTLGKNIFVNTDKKFLVSYSCAVIKHLKGFSNSKYIFYYSISPFIKSHFEQYIMKTTQPNIGIKSIKQFSLPFPPLEEQKAIVQKVEQLMVFCDALEAAVLAKEEKMSALMESGMRGVLK